MLNSMYVNLVYSLTQPMKLDSAQYCHLVVRNNAHHTYSCITNPSVICHLIWNLMEYKETKCEVTCTYLRFISILYYCVWLMRAIHLYWCQVTHSLCTGVYHLYIYILDQPACLIVPSVCVWYEPCLYKEAVSLTLLLVYLLTIYFLVLRLLCDEFLIYCSLCSL